MFIETERGGVLHHPSPKQAARAVEGLGDASGRFAVLVVGEAFVQATPLNGGMFALEYRESAEGPHHQALSVRRSAVVDAFERFAAGDATRSPALRWSQLETRFGSALMSGGERLPDRFYEIAPRLRRGDRPLDIRNDIVAATGVSKLAASKQVEDVQKLLRAARAAIGGGLLTVALGLWYGVSGSLWLGAFWTIAAAGQFAFAYYVFRESSPSGRRSP